MDKVSIIVPMYNVEQYVERCLRSLMAQTYPHIEIIAISDASPDRSVAIATQLVGEIRPGGGMTLVVKELKKNVGQGKVRDFGIKIASGKYIMFVDADDFIHPMTVELSVEKLESHKAQMVEFGFARVSYEPPAYRQIRYPQVDIIEGSTAIERCSDHICWNKLFLKELIEKNRLRFEYRCFEDTAFTRGYSLVCDKAVFLNEQLYYYYVNPNSTTSTLTVDRLALSIERANGVIDVYLEHGLAERAEEYRRSSQKFLVSRLMDMANETKLELGDGVIVKDDTKRIIHLFNCHPKLFRLYGCCRLGLKYTIKRILRKFGLRK